MTQIVQEDKKILKSNNVSDVNHYRSTLADFIANPQLPDLMSPSFKTNKVQGEELSLELGDHRATLTQTMLSLPCLEDDSFYSPDEELLKEAKVIASIPTNVKELLRVACAGSDRAWIHGVENTIHCIDIDGTVRDSVTSTCNPFPDDITDKENCFTVMAPTEQ
jgi:hypothetical protein